MCLPNNICRILVPIRNTFQCKKIHPSKVLYRVVNATSSNSRETSTFGAYMCVVRRGRGTVLFRRITRMKMRKTGGECVCEDSRKNNFKNWEGRFHLINRGSVNSKIAKVTLVGLTACFEPKDMCVWVV